VLSSVTPTTHEGLLGICLSGAGPTILALATGQYEKIAEAASTVFAQHDVKVQWRVLSVCSGAVVKEVKE